MITEASLSKPVTHIGSQEELVKVLKKCIKNDIPVKFEMPFMSKEERHELETGPFGSAWRFQPNFNYENFYNHVGTGDLVRIDANRYVVIRPKDSNLVTDDRLSFSDLYTNLRYSPEDTKMFIDNDEILFENTIRNKTDEISSKIVFEALSDIDNRDKEELNKCKIAHQYIIDFDNSFNNQEDFEDAMAALATQDKEISKMFMQKWSPEKLKSEIDIESGEVEYFVNNPEKALSRYRNIIHYELNEGNNMAKVNEKDIGKPGKNFSKIEKSAAKEYGSKEAGEKVAGAVLSKLKKEHPKKYAAEATEEKPEENKDIKNEKKKFVIELTFPYDGDDDLAREIEETLSKSAEVNEIVRTRRIMEFDFRSQPMLDAAIATIQNIMKEKGKTDYKLDSREDDDVKEDSSTESDDKKESKEESKEVKESTLKESINILIENDEYPMAISLPFLIESLKWASNNRINEEEVLRFVMNLAEGYEDGKVIRLA